MEINDKAIIQRLEEMYQKYGVDTQFLNTLDENRKIKGMKGILAELEIKKKGEYTPDDLLFIQQIYAMYC